MADLRISELPVLSGADAESADDLAIADYSASETKRVTLKGAVQQAVTALIDDGVVPGAKLVSSSVTATQLATGAVSDTKLATDAVTTVAILDGAVTDAKVASGISGGKLTAGSVTATQLATATITANELATDSVGTLEIQAAAVTDAKLASGIDGAKLTAGSVDTTQLANDAVTAAKLADNSVDSLAIVDGVVTNAKLATGIDGAKLQDGTVTDTQLAAGIDGAKLIEGTVASVHLASGAVTAAKLATGSVGTSAIAAAAVTDTNVASGISGTKLTDGTVTNAKLATGIDGTKLSDASVGAAKIAAASITSALLANDAVVAANITDGAVTNAKLATGIDGAKLTAGSVQNAALASGIDGAKLTDSTVTSAKLASGIDGAKLTDASVSAAKFGTVTDRGLDQTGGLIGHTNVVTPGTYNGITFDGQGHITAASTLAASDLPIASTTTVGGISVPAGSGLTVSGIGEVDHANSVSPSTVSGFTFDEHGHITAAASLVSADIPLASTTAVGGVSIAASSALTIDGAGELDHATSTVSPGAYTKVTVDQKGHVTAGSVLASSDIPDLDASKITTGTFSSSFLAPNSVTADQLADYGIAQVSETQPVPEFAGQWWINPNDRSAYVWVGTVSPEVNGYWLLVGYGSPTQLNLRFGGTYNATTNTVVSLNQYGVEAGLTIGQALNAPNSTNNGVYLAVTTAGTGTTPAPTSSLAVGDWVLSQGTGSNWTKIAIVSGAAGTFNDYDILCDGTYFSPNMSGVSDVRDALDLIWGRVQVATTLQAGIVRESTEVLVDNTTGEMTLGVIDDGTF